MADETQPSTIQPDHSPFDPNNPLNIEHAAQLAVVEPATLTAPERLRAFEDHLFGADCVRIRGLIERGYGSKFKEMTPEQHRHYAALEKLVVAEQALADARAALSAAEDTNAKAEVEVSASEPAVHAAPAE